jgi:nucleoside-diphosphate-sugar epimerase
LSNSTLLLITGANGFVGRAVARRSAGEGRALRLCSRRPIVGFPAGAESIAGLELEPGTNWRPVLDGVAVVVHCAARVHMLKDNSADPAAEFRRVNAEGTASLAEQAARSGVRRFVFISSIGVNGVETFGSPFTAEDAPDPHSPYAQSKYEAELALRNIASGSGMEIVTIRPPLIYGPGAPGNFARLLRVVRLGMPLPLANVDNRRSFVAIDNLVDLIESVISHPAARNRTLLVSDGEDVSTPQLLRRMAHFLGRPARLFPMPVSMIRAGAALLRKTELVQQLCGSLQVDITGTKALLNWSPPVSVDLALRHAVQGSLVR